MNAVYTEKSTALQYEYEIGVSQSSTIFYSGQWSAVSGQWSVSSGMREWCKIRL